MSANNKQIAGDHYQAYLQHWDLLIEFGYTSEYFIGQATKYISRWRKKNGLVDLRKGLHFVEKLHEVTESEGLGFLQWGYKPQRIIDDAAEHYRPNLERFFTANGIGVVERHVIVALLFVSTLDGLLEIRDVLEKLIKDTEDEILTTNSMTDFEYVEHTNEQNSIRWRKKSTGEVQELKLDTLPTIATWK